jgi:hypothetical protein
VGVTSDRLDLENTILDIQERDIEKTPPKWK